MTSKKKTNGQKIGYDNNKYIFLLNTSNRPVLPHESRNIMLTGNIIKYLKILNENYQH